MDSFLGVYGRVEAISQLQAAAGTSHGDDVFRACLDRVGFQAIPIYHKDRQMMVVIEGKRPHCWNCKQVGHIAKVCPRKAPNEVKTTQLPNPPEVEATKETSETEKPPSTEGGWTQVTRWRRKSDTPKKAEDTM